MKTIGLLGGTSWPSTLDYYQTLNRMVAERLGGFHSANLILKSIDYHEIKSCYGKNWDKVPALLEKEVLEALSYNPDIFMICNNTLHKALDALEIDFGSTKLIHIVNEVGREAQRRGFQKLLLLGTKLTMEDGYYAMTLIRDFQLEVGIPDGDDRNDIQALQTQIAAGVDPSSFRPRFSEILSRYRDYDAVVLACTELPLAITQDVTKLPILNPTYLQCRAAFEAALS